jgi:hypothetical protein
MIKYYLANIVRKNAFFDEIQIQIEMFFWNLHSIESSATVF